jgi:Fe-S oxidoreductase
MFLLGEGRSMDSCLHCEACRVECPLSIDIPQLMWKAQGERAAKRGRSLRDRLMGNPEVLARLGSLTAPVSNVAASAGPGKTVIKKAFGLDAKRQLPGFRRSTFAGRFAKREVGRGWTSPRGRVAYYAGCFANYYEPEVAEALVRVMKRSGFEVVVPGQKCCGLPMMASKNVAGARENAEYNIGSLAALAASGCDIVTTCPSCSLMIKREYLNFFDSDEARLVAERTFYVDEYLMRLHRRGALDTGLRPVVAPVLYHVPCHQKVQDTVSDTLDLLCLIPGLTIEKVNTACCGMGGYHGYKEAHASQSMEIGAKLFGEVKSLSPGSQVVTSCAACRLQIEAGTGVQAVHPVLLLQEAYGIRRSGPS